MKTKKLKLTVLLIISLLTIQGYSKERPEYKICKQKNIPFEVSSNFDQNLLQVKIMSEKAISEFSIIKARGIKGLKVDKLQDVSNISLKAGEFVETQVEISHLSGKGYVVFDIAYKERGILTKRNIVIPLGELSAEQISERKKNIKSIIKDSSKKDQNNGKQKTSAESPTENVHYMNLK